MVHKIEAACKKLDVEFLGWEKTAADVSLRFRKGGLYASLLLPVNTLELLGTVELRARISNLFNPPAGVVS